ncbi:hypothetical protein ILUMI_11343 [Ignelater luminosus]|uniref:Retrotransposon gag domain-containing protein n=1 Tax=Ignelater luminosus TaxID=2038154 RepID=A0A8K0D0B1_IGNLU|nr:hypothetical protein ILUMI_11343 [Ignelater luminosus]
MIIKTLHGEIDVGATAAKAWLEKLVLQKSGTTRIFCELNTWDNFKDRFENTFNMEASLTDKWSRMVKGIPRSDESLSTYFHDKYGLCRALNLTFPETKEQILVGLSSKYVVQELLAKNHEEKDLQILHKIYQKSQNLETNTTSASREKYSYNEQSDTLMKKDAYGENRIQLIETVDVTEVIENETAQEILEFTESSAITEVLENGSEKEVIELTEYLVTAEALQNENTTKKIQLAENVITGDLVGTRQQRGELATQVDINEMGNYQQIEYQNYETNGLMENILIVFADEIDKIADEENVEKLMIPNDVLPNTSVSNSTSEKTAKLSTINDILQWPKSSVRKGKRSIQRTPYIINHISVL